MDKAKLLGNIAGSVYKGKREDLESLTLQALQEGIPPQELMTQGFLIGMRDIGDTYKQGKVSAIDMLMTAIAVADAMKTIRPYTVRYNVKPIGTFVVGSVFGDTHDLGKNIVAMVMEGFGFNVIDVGVDVSAEKFVQAAQQHHADIIGMSSLLSTTRIRIAPTIEVIRESILRNRVKIMVGGAAVTKAFADSVGADGYGVDAWEAAEVAKTLVGAPTS